MDAGQTPCPGEIYRADWPAGHDARILVISRESLNRGDRVIALNITSEKVDERSSYPNCVALERGSFGLNKDCVIQCENVVTLRKERIDAKPIGALDAETMREVLMALAYVFDATFEQA